MFTLVVFILILGLLVFVHEFGHFIAARLTGMKVYEFAIGYPPRMFGVYKDPKTGKFVWVWRRGKKSKKPVDDIPDLRQEFPSTLYSLHLLPLGGFCNIKGENGENSNDTDSFGHQKIWKRFVVLLAGVVMNILLAAVLFSVGFIVGLPADISGLDDDKIIIVDQPQVIVQMVEKNSPADKAGLMFGDKIVSLYGIEINSSNELIDAIQTYEEGVIDMKVDRSGQEVSLEVVPELKDDGKKQIGIMMADAAIVRYPWYIAIYKGFVASGIALVNIFVAFGILIGNLVVGKGLAFEVSGPVGIAVVLGQSARLGISYLINATAMISLSLAAINILPIPALDGGRILFLGIEKIIRKPVPVKYEQIAHTIGFALLMVLIIVVTGRDILNFF
ncbi:MAG: RIP metalloprotease RseP [Candidatus Magasanikbacteria bacterium]|nr:RIP metalloprotease RseP [Candidatus Magasanikbacteria bacterium]